MVDKNELYKFLVSLAHSPKTILPNRVINNPDAIILLFHSAGGQLTAKQLEEFSMDWRGSKCLLTYFGPHSGYTGSDFSSQVIFSCSYSGSPCSGAPKSPPPWYRTPFKRPYRNALTADGFKRLSTLLESLPPELNP